MGDIFDAYMDIRDGNLDSRVFNRVANAILAAEALEFSVTDHDLASLRAQRKPFNAIAAKLFQAE